MSSQYPQTYKAWHEDPEQFWASAAKEIDWIRPWDKVFDGDVGVYGRWFTGGQCNTCHNCLDRHVAAGRGSQPALIYMTVRLPAQSVPSPMTNFWVKYVP